MARKKIVKDREGNTVELDQDAIDRALAGAVTDSRGPVQMRNETKKDEWEVTPPPPPEKEAPVADLCVEGTCVEGARDEGKIDGETPNDDASQVALSQKDFVKACYDLNINAKQCFYQSSKVDDKSIVEYIRSINKKIYDETQKGGYSTNVQFRVTPQDWVNVNHIFDWYRVRGFQVDVKETTTAPYGKEVGTMNYNFSISWSQV